jgi:hypothetical protein
MTVWIWSPSADLRRKLSASVSWYGAKQPVIRIDARDASVGRVVYDLEGNVKTRDAQICTRIWHLECCASMICWRAGGRAPRALP